MSAHKMDYPEHEKLKKVSKTSQSIGEFLDWLKGPPARYVLAKWTVDDDGHDKLFPSYISIEKLLAQYFEIDLNKIEAEKRAMLEELRRLNEERATEEAKPS